MNNDRAERFKSPPGDFVIVDGPLRGQRLDGGELTPGQIELLNQRGIPVPNQIEPPPTAAGDEL